jgi:hypothetical protein
MLAMIQVIADGSTTWRVTWRRDEHDGERDLRRDAQPEPEDEDRPQHDARDRVHHLDIGREDVGEQLDAAERDAADDAEHDADEEPDRRLLQRHGDLLRQRAGVGAVLDPRLELGGDLAGLAEEERVDDAGAGTGLPAGDQHDEERDAQSEDPGAPPRDPRPAARARDVLLGGVQVGRHSGRHGDVRGHAAPSLAHAAAAIGPPAVRAYARCTSSRSAPQISS